MDKEITEKKRDRKTLEQRKAELQKSLAELNKKINAQERKNNTRKKIIVGAFYLEKAEQDNDTKNKLLSALKNYLTRDDDRALFGLDIPKLDNSISQVKENETSQEIEPTKDISKVTKKTQNSDGKSTSKSKKLCPKCGQEMKLRSGTNGQFWGCSGYPTCNYTENLKI